jgi:2-desacetyl-2-hydroxyethyl bacteriochlorophyllide A dehydrogenase
MPTAPPGKVVIKVNACGICGTDLHVMDGSSFHPQLPFTLGHEPVGTVAAVGSSADERWLGAKVTATIFEGCGSCDECKAGNERLCRSMIGILGLHSSPGAYAEYTVAPSRHLVPVPPALSSQDTACLVDAGPTALNAFRVTQRFGDTKAIVVAGAGPIGLLVAELFRRTGADPLIVESNELRRSMASKRGHRIVSSVDDVEDDPHVIFECTGSEAVVKWACQALRPHGKLIVVGFPTVNQISFLPLVRKELKIIGIRSGTSAELREILEFAADGSLPLPEVSEWPLERINDALGLLRSGQVAGKCVVVPASTFREAH